MIKTLADQKMVNATDAWKPATLEDLRGSGVGIANFSFIKGDRLSVPENLEVSEVRFKPKGRDDEMSYYLLKVQVTGTVRGVSLASFRKDRYGIEAFVREYHNKCKVARDLAACANDEERALYLAGHDFIISDVFQGRSYRFLDGIRSYDPNDTNTYKEGDWPIFDMVEG